MIAAWGLGCGQEPPDDGLPGSGGAGVPTTGADADETDDGTESSGEADDAWEPAGESSSDDGGTSSSGAPADGSGDRGPEPFACAAIAAQWIDLGGGQIEADFDGAAERPPITFDCDETIPGSVTLTVVASGYNIDLGELVSTVDLDAIELVVPEGVVVGSYTTAEAALTTGVLSPSASLSIQIAGRIQGAGGHGGFGGVCNVPSLPGEPGGVALELTVPALVVAYFESDGAEATGEIWGGGGGGGGGGDGCDEVYCGGTGAGGGGAGSLPGLGGDAQHPSGLPSLDGGGTCGDFGGTNFAGTDGTTEEGGTGQNGGLGGAPGEPGGPGHPGQPSFQTTAGQAGGQPGCAFVSSIEGMSIEGGDVRPATQDGCHGLPTR